MLRKAMKVMFSWITNELFQHTRHWVDRAEACVSSLRRIGILWCIPIRWFRPNEPGRSSAEITELGSVTECLFFPENTHTPALSTRSLMYWNNSSVIEENITLIAFLSIIIENYFILIVQSVLFLSITFYFLILKLFLTQRHDKWLYGTTEVLRINQFLYEEAIISLN